MQDRKFVLPPRDKEPPKGTPSTPLTQATAEEHYKQLQELQTLGKVMFLIPEEQSFPQGLPGEYLTPWTMDQVELFLRTRPEVRRSIEQTALERALAREKK